MRIPSEFNSDNLYRRRGRRLGTTDAARRVMRMSLALLLVIVVMKTASQEAIYRPFFPETTTVIDRKPSNTATIANQPNQAASANPRKNWFSPIPMEAPNHSRGYLSTGYLSTEQSELIAAVIEPLPRQDRLEWALAINRFAMGHWQTSMPSSLELLRREIRDNQEAKAVDRMALTEAFERLSKVRIARIQSDGGVSINEENSTVQLEPPDQAWMMGVYREIFDGFIKKSSDGSVWRPSDRDALRLLLEQAKWAAQTGVDSQQHFGEQVGVIPLLQQPEVYRGKHVHIRGSVARVEAIEPKNDEERSSDTTNLPMYYQLWLRPNHGVARPLVAVTDRIPERLRALGSLELIDEGPEVVIVGTFLKRLAYRSGKGVDLAPVIVGTLQGANGGFAQQQAASSTRESAPPDHDNRNRIIMPVITATGLGLLLAILIMWRTQVSAARTRELRKAKQSKQITLTGMLLIGFVLFDGTETRYEFLSRKNIAVAQSPQTLPSRQLPTGLNLVSGFDLQRLGRVYPFDQPEAVAESAKLLDRLRRVSRETLLSRSKKMQGPHAPVRGDVFTVKGQLKRTQSIKIPAAVAEFLEFPRISFSQFEVERTGLEPLQVQVVSLPFARQAQAGDEFSMTGILVSPWTDPSGTPAAPKIVGMVCPISLWYPAHSDSPSHAHLVSQGFNMSLITSLKQRDRQPLTPVDSDAFYQLMQIAAQPSPAISPDVVSPVDLLRDSKSKIGTLVSLPLETIEVIRIEVTDRLRRQQLGQDHYFQIDAMGDLAGAVRLEIAPTDENPQGGEVLFENRYPVSIVTKRLPEFLAGQLKTSTNNQAILRDVRVRMLVNGYFFRLWSYSSELMDPYGDKQQFGPLIVGSSFKNLEVQGVDPIGVRWIGWAAACFISIGMLAIFLWHQWTSRADARIRQQRRAEEITPPQHP